MCHIVTHRVSRRDTWLCLAILIGLAGVAWADPPRATPVGFDHLVHDRDLVVGGGEALACVRCHVVRAGRLVGRPDHRVCFGACHGAAPTRPHEPVAADRRRVCTACHAEDALVPPFTGSLRVGYPPYTFERDFGLTLSHKQHGMVACTQCHGAAKPSPHERCAGCHDGERARPMTECSRCHPAAIGRPQPPELAAVRNTVISVFSHGKHAARGGAGKDCKTCHARIADTDDTELPRPTVKDCAGCHDGKTAFATTTACTRCHDKAPDKFVVDRPDRRFSHGGVHAPAVTSRPCGACHPLGKRGEVVVAGHAACAGCHADDFGKRHPTICGACHNATEPWRPLVADRAPPDETEFGATLDHAKHPGACASCHVLRTRTSQLRTPRGHAACTGTACHAVSGGPAPQLASCDGCHRLGRATARSSKRAADAWSVRAAFDHRAHAPTACTTCHTALAGDNVVELPAPSKTACAPCHDGKATFGLTGTTCARCHQ